MIRDTSTSADGPAGSNEADTADAPASAESQLEAKITVVGDDLARSFGEVLEAIPGGPHGTANLARTLGIDKVLSSRLLKAARSRDPLAVAHLMPGPDPLRRVLRGAAKKNIDPVVIETAENAVSRFEQLIRSEAGDRGSLDAMISAWLPEARAQFEFRRKQSAFKAMSQIMGAMAEINLGTAILAPSEEDPARLDIIWFFGLLGLHRLRPGAAVKLATRRMVEDGRPRLPRTLAGEPVESYNGLRLEQFCSHPPPKLAVNRAGEIVHYTLAGDEFGPKSAVDLILAEKNLAEIDRYVPRERGRKANVFAEVGTPTKLLQFDVLLHDDVYPGSEPELRVYDTALDGVADVNDPSRDIDQFDLAESIQLLGRGPARIPSPHVSQYDDLVRHAFDQLGWNLDAFRGYRCTIDYPVYGSQVAMVFDPPPPPPPTNP